MPTVDELRAWRADLVAFAAQAGGVIDLTAIRPPDIEALFAAAEAGEPKALRLVHAVGGLIARAESGEPTLCAACDADLATAPFSAVIAWGHRDDPTRGIAMGVCTACGIEPDAVLAAALAGLRRVFPRLQPIDLQSHGAGHA